MSAQYEDFYDFEEEKPVQPAQISGVSEGEIDLNPQNGHLFTVLDRGDKIIQKAHSKAIILVGLSRKGKSTTFNWILGNSMIGQAKGEQSFYVNCVDQNGDVAKVADKFASVTLAPNLFVDFIRRKKEKKEVIQISKQTGGKQKEVEELTKAKANQLELDDDEERISLFDMAGYEDKRNYVGVIGVSYFLKEVFERVSQAKFIIVLSENMFQDTSGQGITKTFQGFFNMFHYKQMPKQIRAQLRKSIVVVITKARLTLARIYEKLKAILKKIKQEQFKLQGKGAIVEILSWLLISQRMELFAAAVVNRPPQMSTFIRDQSQKPKDPWVFFDLKATEIAMKKSPISLPFVKDFQRLPANQISQFEATIDKRVKSYKGFAKIAYSLIHKFVKNWQNFVQNQPNTSFNCKNMKQVFDQINSYNQTNDLYKQNCQPVSQLKITQESFSFMQCVKASLNIYQSHNKISSMAPGYFCDNMNIYSKQFGNIIEQFKGFARGNQDHRALYRLNYIVQRGIKEFKRLYQLKQSSITEANQKLKDYLDANNQLYPKNQFTKNIIKHMKPEVLQKLFPSVSLIEQYEDFFVQNQTSISQSQSQLSLKEHRQIIELTKAGLWLKVGNKPKALLCYIRAFFLIQQINKIAKHSQQQKVQSQKNLYMKKIKMIRTIVQVLKVLPDKQEFQPLDEALRLCQQANMMQDVQEIYQILINSPAICYQKRVQTYLNYADYLALWGSVQQAIKVLKKRLKIIEYDYTMYSDTVQRIKRFNNDRTNYYRQFNNNLTNMTRLSINDQTLNSSLEQLKYWVQML